MLAFLLFLTDFFNIKKKLFTRKMLAREEIRPSRLLEPIKTSWSWRTSPKFSLNLSSQNSQQVELEGRHDHPVMNPSSSLDLWAASLPYIDSDVSDSDDCSYSTRRTCQLEKEPSNEQPAPSKTTDAMMTTTTDPAKG